MTTETETVENRNLVPFKSGELRTLELAKKGGSQSTKKKKISAKLRELKKKYPFCHSGISDFLAILISLDNFVAVSEAELIELVILKNEAIARADAFEDKCKIQGDYISLLLEVGLLFYGKEKIIAYQDAIQQSEQEKMKIPVMKRFELARKYRELGIKEPPELSIDIDELIVAVKLEKEKTQES